MKRMKKLASIVLALVMVFAMAIPAMAADTKTKISIANATNGHTYKAYQILTGDITPDPAKAGSYVIANAKWGTGVAEAFTEGKDLEKFLDGLNGQTAEKANDLATELMKDGNLTEVCAESKDMGDTYEIADLDPGYYLVVDESTNDVLSAYVVEVVTGDTVEVIPKTGEPEFEKKVQDINDSKDTAAGGLQDSADYDIGDHVPFTLTATLPEKYNDFKEYYLAFHDDLSDGLDLDADSIKVTIGDTDITNAFVRTFGSVDDDDFDLVCENLKNYPEIQPGAVIVVTYTATLTKEAKIGSEGNPNTAYLEYSRDPNHTGEGTPKKETPKDTVIVFTYKLDISKVDENTEPLAGATFELTKYNAVTGEWEAIDRITINDEKTKFEFNGLDDGYYCLKETATPPGYNTIEDIYFEVVATHDETSDAPTLGSLSATQKKDGNVADMTDMEEGSITFVATPDLPTGSIASNVVNQKGTTLPETGGIGTTIFYVVGAILVVGAVVLLVTKKRMSSEQ